METMIQPRFSMAEEEVEEMVAFLETLPPGPICDVCHHTLFDKWDLVNEHIEGKIFDRKTGEAINVCYKCWDNFNQDDLDSLFVVSCAETLEEALREERKGKEIALEERRKAELNFKVFKEGMRILQKEGFTCTMFRCFMDAAQSWSLRHDIGDFLKVYGVSDPW